MLSLRERSRPRARQRGGDRPAPSSSHPPPAPPNSYSNPHHRSVADSRCRAKLVVEAELLLVDAGGVPFSTRPLCYCVYAPFDASARGQNTPVASAGAGVVGAGSARAALLAGRDVPAACKIALSVAPYSFLRGAAPVLPDRGAVALGPETILSFLEPVPGIAPSALGGEPGKLATPHVMNTRVNVLLSRTRVALPPGYEERWLAALTGERNAELGLLDGLAGIPADARVTSAVVSRALLARAHNGFHTVAETRVALDVELGRGGAFLVTSTGGPLVLTGVPVAPGLVLSFLLEYTVTEESVDAAASRAKVLGAGGRGHKGAVAATATYVIAVGDAMPCTAEKIPAQGSRAGAAGAAGATPVRARFRLGKNALPETERPWQVRLTPPFAPSGGSGAHRGGAPSPSLLPAHGPDAVPWLNANGGGIDALIADGDGGADAVVAGAGAGAVAGAGAGEGATAGNFTFFVGGDLSVRLPVVKPVVSAVTPARGGSGALLSPSARAAPKSAVSFASMAKAVKENSAPGANGGAAAAARKARHDDESDGSDGSSESGDFSDSEIGSFHSPTSRVSDVLSPSPPPRPAVVRDAQGVRAAAERAEPSAQARPPLSRRDGGDSTAASSIHGGHSALAPLDALQLQPPAPVERIDSLLGALLDLKVSAFTPPASPPPDFASLAATAAPPPILSSDALALFTDAAVAGSLRASAARGRSWSGVGSDAASMASAAVSAHAPVTRTFSCGLTPLHGLPLPLRDAARLASFGLPVDVKAMGVDAPAPAPDVSVEASDPRAAHIVTILFAAFVPNASRASASKRPATTIHAAAAADSGAIEPRATAALSSPAEHADDPDDDGAASGIPHSVSIGCQFYTAPYVRVGPAQLDRPRGAPASAGAPAPAEQHLLVNVPRGAPLPERRGPGTFPSICVRVDPSAAPPAERSAFASYLCNGDLQIDVWDGDSLLPLGTATIALSVRPASHTHLRTATQRQLNARK